MNFAKSSHVERMLLEDYVMNDPRPGKELELLQD